MPGQRLPCSLLPVALGQAPDCLPLSFLVYKMKTQSGNDSAWRTVKAVEVLLLLSLSFYYSAFQLPP